MLWGGVSRWSLTSQLTDKLLSNSHQHIGFLRLKMRKDTFTRIRRHWKWSVQETKDAVISTPRSQKQTSVRSNVLQRPHDIHSASNAWPKLCQKIAARQQITNRLLSCTRSSSWCLSGTNSGGTRYFDARKLNMSGFDRPLYFSARQQPWGLMCVTCDEVGQDPVKTGSGSYYHWPHQTTNMLAYWQKQSIRHSSVIFNSLSWLNPNSTLFQKTKR